MQIAAMFLSSIYSKVNDREGLPKWFCYECSAMLHKFDKFKDKCNKGQVTLRQMHWSKGVCFTLPKKNKSLSKKSKTKYTLN